MSRNMLSQRYMYIAVAVVTVLVLVSWLRADSFDIRRVSLERQTDTIMVSDPSRMQLFYGELESLPHTYTFSIREATPFHTRIMIPVDGAETISGILVREPEGKGRVTEVARLHGDEASWEVARLSITGDPYREGPAFDAELTPGRYRLEVHTADNTEPYLLRIGTEAERTMGYSAFIGELASLKQFLGKAGTTIVFSPYVYAPLYCVLLIVWGAYLWYRRRHVVQ